MNAKIEDFKTGWYGISISIRENEIDFFIDQLTELKESKNQHFHISSTSEGDEGVVDIEFSLQENEVDNMYFTGFAINPNR